MESMVLKEQEGVRPEASSTKPNHKHTGLVFLSYSEAKQSNRHISGRLNQAQLKQQEL